MIEIYVYVEGVDLHDREALLAERFAHFLKIWNVESTRLINDKHPRAPDLVPEDIPQWDLGLNARFAYLERSHVEELIHFLNALARESGHEFVIGGSFGSGYVEDLSFVGAELNPDTLEFLVEIFQRREPQ